MVKLVCGAHHFPKRCTFLYFLFSSSLFTPRAQTNTAQQITTTKGFFRKSEGGVCPESGVGDGRQQALMHPVLPGLAEFKTFPTLSKERLLQMVPPPRPQPQQNPMGRRFGCFFSFSFLSFFLFLLFLSLSVSYGLEITNESPLLSANHQLVPESESPAQFRWDSPTTQGRFSPVRLFSF